MFVVLVVAVVVLVHAYVWWRGVRGARLPRRWERGAAVVFVVGAAAAVAAVVTRRILPPGPAGPLHLIGYTWLAVLLYAALLLVVGELVRLVVRVVGGRSAATPSTPDAGGPPTPRPDDPGSPSRRLVLSRVIAAVAGLLAVGTVGYGLAVARRLHTEEVEVVLDRLDPAFDGFRIAAVTDVHLGPLMGRDDLIAVVAAVNAARPDLVAVVGDLVDGDVAELREHVAPLRDLAAPTYFVTGNHEYYSGARQWVEHLPTLGVRVLRNERVELRRGTAALDLAGCDDRTAAASGEPGHRFDLDAALAGRDPDRAVVLLAHQPVMVAQAAAAGVDLQVAGHTHGSQLRPVSDVARIDQPALAGLHRFGPTWLYVSRGIGFWGPPARVGSPAEVTVLILRGPRR